MGTCACGFKLDLAGGFGVRMPCDMCRIELARARLRQVELKYTEGRSEARARELGTEAHLAQLARREQARPARAPFLSPSGV